MSVTIYVDVLFFINLIINYLILCATAILSGRELLKLRTLAGASLGALYSVFIFFPSVSFLFWNVMKIFISALIVLVSFHFKNIISFAKLFVCFYAVTLVFGGGMFAFYYFTSAGSQMNYSNGVYYIDLPLWLLITLSVLFYVFIKVIVRITDSRKNKSLIQDVEIECLGKTLTITAMVDTGNSLYDPITLAPVMLAQLECFEGILCPQLIEAIKRGDSSALADLPAEYRQLKLRIIPYKDIGGQRSMIFAFKPTKIRYLKNKATISNMLVGFVTTSLSPDDSFKALLHSGT